MKILKIISKLHTWIGLEKRNILVKNPLDLNLLKNKLLENTNTNLLKENRILIIRNHKKKTNKVKISI